MREEETGVVCDIAQTRHRGAIWWRNLWTLLLWAMGAAITYFLIKTVLFMLQEAWIPAALVTVGTIATGGGIKWVTDRRKESVLEEETMYEDMANACRIDRR